jgi:sialate O-acetylesterase
MRAPARLTPLLMLILGLPWASCPARAVAEIVLPYVFADGAVLQRDVPAAVWGTSSPGARVTAQFRGSSREATANADGKWSLRLPPIPAAGEPAAMTITSSDPRDAARTIQGVLVGDVWFCSGQSNMYFPLGKSGEYPGAEGGEEAIASPPDPQLRLICDDQNPIWQSRGWRSATAESRRWFSAVAYYFGARLRREVGVPIGLIHVSRGGSVIQKWTPLAYAERVPVTRRFNALFARERARIAEYNRQHAEREKAARQGRPLPEPPATLPADVMAARSFTGSTAYDRLVVPLVPYTLRGVVWYQGESNSGHPEVAQHYAEMLRALVDGWRDGWGAPDLPFYFVQLPCFEKGELWPWTRQAMLVASRSIPNCAMVVITDLGDVTNLHPPQKQPVGERLADAALARTYGRRIPCSGPTIAQVRSDGSAVVLTFDPTDGAPRVKRDGWRDVELAGADGQFHPATVTLTGDRAEARSDSVPAPVAIRYGWRAVFSPSLVNDAGLPASGFYYVRDTAGVWSLYSPAASAQTDDSSRR